MRDDDRTDLPGWLGLRKIPDLTEARWLGPLLTIVVIVLFVMAVLVIFAVLGHALFDFGMEDVPRIGFGTGAVAVALIGAPFVIWRSVVAQKTVTLQEQGHITDRINTAVEGLGAEKTVKLAGEDEKTAPNLEVRIGAIYALERIAQDSNRDHVQIMEILCAYVRQNAPVPAEDDWPELEMKESEDDRPLEADWDERLGTFRKEQDEKKATLKLREDIQTALTVIGRRSTRQRRLEAGRGVEAEFPFDLPCPEYDGPDVDHDPAALDAYQKELDAWREKLVAYQGYRLDLRGADLRGVDLHQLDLKGAKLDGAYLQGSDLRQAQLQGAVLTGARLQGADLTEARLQGADLWKAWLQGADLGEALVQGAALAKARLHGAYLWGAQLQCASLEFARLQGATLGRSGLQGANLPNASLQGASFSELRMTERQVENGHLHTDHFAGPRFQGANLANAKLSNIKGFNNDIFAPNFRGVAVANVDFTDLPQIVAHVAGMFGDASVTLPGGHGPEHEDWPKHWPKFELGNDSDDEWRKWQADPEGYRPPDPPEMG